MNPTSAENQLPGSPHWQLRNIRFDAPVTMASFPLVRHLRSSAIEGYASKTGIYPGETIDFMISLDPPGELAIDIYRMGYYGGIGARHMTRIAPLSAAPQPMPAMSMQRLRECAWQPAAALTIPDDWRSGVYLAKLTRDEGPYGVGSYIIFVVKSRRQADILCQVSDLTWQAYNKWPANDSLYTDGTANVWYQGTEVRVSFDRPYAKYCQVLDAPLSTGSGEFLLWEHPMAYWLEREGYDVAYCSNLDLHLDPSVLDRCKAFLSVGHDEYWSREMFNAALNARDDGLSLAFFSGNSVYWEIEFHDSENNPAAACRAFSPQTPIPRRRGATNGRLQLRPRLRRLDNHKPRPLVARKHRPIPRRLHPRRHRLGIPRRPRRHPRPRSNRLKRTLPGRQNPPRTRPRRHRLPLPQRQLGIQRRNHLVARGLVPPARPHPRAPQRQLHHRPKRPRLLRRQPPHPAHHRQHPKPHAPRLPPRLTPSATAS